MDEIELTVDNNPIAIIIPVLNDFLTLSRKILGIMLSNGNLYGFPLCKKDPIQFFFERFNTREIGEIRTRIKVTNHSDSRSVIFFFGPNNGSQFEM